MTEEGEKEKERKKNGIMEVRAPGVVKLFGEHAVVYGKRAIAAAVDMWATAVAEKLNGRNISISMPDLDFESEFSCREAGEAYERYLSEDIGKIGKDYERLKLPYMVIIGRLLKLTKNGTGLKLKISSNIPLQKGFASSGACSTAAAIAAAKLFGASLDYNEIIDIARDGERIMHLNKNAGAIDVSTTFYGGIVSYKAGSIARHNEIKNGIELVIIDTGPKKSTAETVGHVSELYNKDRKHAEEILAQIDGCSDDGLDALRKSDMARLGKAMSRNHELLKMLGVSSKGLDLAVSEGIGNGAYGVKLSGGGGGGIAIAVPSDRELLIKTMNELGFKAYPTKIAKDGAVSFVGPG